MSSRRAEPERRPGGPWSAGTFPDPEGPSAVRTDHKPGRAGRSRGGRPFRRRGCSGGRPFPWGTLFVHSIVIHRLNGHQLQSGDRSTRRSSRTRSVAEHGPRRYWVRVRAPGAGRRVGPCWAWEPRSGPCLSLAEDSGPVRDGSVHALTKAPRCSMLLGATRPTRRSGQSAQSTLPVTTRQTTKHNVTPGRYMATERNPRPRSRSLISRSRRARKHKTRTP